MLNFHIQTFGCQMNVNDSEWLSRSLIQKGFIASSFEDADFFIINTCSVRDKPEQKVYSELGRIARFAKLQKRNDITICVGGCVAQQVGEALTKRFPEVRLLFGADGIAKAPEAILRLAEEPSLRLSLLDFVEHFEERTSSWQGVHAPVSSYVNIMQGCDNFCTYCVVPYVRGRQKSRQPEAILQECTELLQAGAREITLLGQNVNSYGQDALGNGLTFMELLSKVSALPNLARLRFVTPHPKDMAEEVIGVFGTLPNLCPRLHLPLQSGSDAILKKMGRRYTSGHFLALVEKLKKTSPDMLFSTDIIVGFPGETDADFQATMHMMELCQFVGSFSFVYSDRPHAKATLLGDKVPRSVALERLSVLQDWQDAQTQKMLLPYIGQTVEVLLENPSNRPVLLDGIPANSTTDADNTEYWHAKCANGLAVHVVLAKNSGKGAGDIVQVAVQEVSRNGLKGTWCKHD